MLSASDCKALPAHDLEQVFAVQTWKTRPFPFQLACLALGLYHGRVAYWLDVGMGKSLIALYLADLWKCKRVLVVCPSSVIRTWREQLNLHTERPCVVLCGSRRERRLVLHEGGDAVYVINYEGLKVAFGAQVEKIGKDNRPHRVWVADQDALREAHFDYVIFDEAHHLANSSLQQRLAADIASKSTFCVLLTGTPITKNLLSLWFQYYVLDRGKSLGNNFFAFRRRYFIRLDLPCKGGTFPKYVLRSGAEQEILKRIEPITMRYDQSECYQLPERIYQTRWVRMTTAQRQATEVVRRGLAADIENGVVTIGNVLQCSGAGKLAQITGGFIYDENHVACRFDPNPKITELIELLRETGRRAVVYHRFVEEGRMIEEALQRAGFTYRSVRGEVPDRERQINEFCSDAKVDVLVAQGKTGGEGLNLQVATLLVFYSNHYEGSTVRVQCEGRAYRIGQHKNVVVVDILMENSIDEHIYNLAMGSAKDAKAILDYIRGNGSSEKATSV